MSGGSAVEISQKENGADFWKKKNKRIYTHAMGRRLKERRLILPESYEKIEREALKNNVRLRTVCLPKQIESIGVQAFMNCTSLYQIEYTDIVRIQREAFCGCNHLVSFRLPESKCCLGRARSVIAGHCSRWNLRTEAGSKNWKLRYLKAVKSFRQ